MFGKNTIDGLILEIEGAKLKDLLLRSQEGIANLYVNFCSITESISKELNRKFSILNDDGIGPSTEYTSATCRLRANSIEDTTKILRDFSEATGIKLDPSGSVPNLFYCPWNARNKIALEALADYDQERMDVIEDFKRNLLGIIDDIGTIKPFVSEEKKYSISSKVIVSILGAPRNIKNEYEREMAGLFKATKEVCRENIRRNAEENLRLYELVAKLELQEQRNKALQEIGDALIFVGESIFYGLGSIASSIDDANLLYSANNGLSHTFGGMQVRGSLMMKGR